MTPAVNFSGSIDICAADWEWFKSAILALDQRRYWRRRREYRARRARRQIARWRGMRG